MPRRSYKQNNDFYNPIVIIIVAIVVVLFVITKIISISNNDYHGSRGGHYKINRNGNKRYLPQN